MNDELKALVTKLYRESGVVVEPTYPRILVRLLPREQVSRGGIILPDNDQNKPNLEGLVLATYKPFWKTILDLDPSNWEFSRAKTVAELREDGFLAERKVWVEPAVQIGDHVCFPHMDYGITPVWPLDGGKGDYRLVPDEKLSAKLTYMKETTKEWLVGVLDLSHGLGEEVADALMAKAEIVRKDLHSVTVSGR